MNTFSSLLQKAVILTVLLNIWIQVEAENTQLATEADILQVFVREGCPHCAAAKEFLPVFAQEHPELTIVYHPVDSDVNARNALVLYSHNAGIWPPGVPTFVYHDKVLSGFESPEKTRPKLLALLGGDAEKEYKVETRLLGTLDVSSVGLPLFTLALGLIDGFNACAMWVLLFLLSMLVHLKNRMRMALIAGTFVLVSGAVYYAFMAAWLNLFLAVGLSMAIRLFLASVAMVIGVINIRNFFSDSSSVALSIPDAAKPGIYARMRTIIQARSLPLALLAATALAVVVNFIELLCTAGLPAMYTAILVQQNLPAISHYAYLGLYILGYIADDSLMVGLAVMALSSRKLTENTGQWLKLLSGLVMLMLGIIMILQPEWLV